MDSSEKLDAAERRLKRALKGLVSAHKRKSKNGKISNVDSYYRTSNGKKLSMGDIVVDAYGNKKTVLTVEGGRVVFSDFTTMPEGWNYQVAGNALDSTGDTGTVIDPKTGTVVAPISGTPLA